MGQGCIRDFSRRTSRFLFEKNRLLVRQRGIFIGQYFDDLFGLVALSSHLALPIDDLMVCDEFRNEGLLEVKCGRNFDGRHV